MGAEPDAPDDTPFARLGGSAAIGRIVERFYDLMERDPAYAELRAMHAPDLGPMRQSLAGFLAAWSGGPRDWFDAHPGKCMMSAHAGIAMDGVSGAQWAAAMRRAVADAGIGDAEMALAFADRLGEIALAMGRMGESRA